MRTYSVIIKATVTQTIEVNALNEDEALEKAHDEFSILNETANEQYSQETVDWSDVTVYRRKCA